jgi:hypothetical protein
MDRRAFIGCLAAIATMPRVARAQLPRKVYRIGILSLSAASDVAGPTPQSPSTRALLRGLNELGYVYGRDFVTETRGGEGKPEHFATLDPVGQGFVQSLGHPGGNFTGFSLQSSETVGKRLELLKDLVPGSAPLVVLWDQPSIIDWQAAQAGAGERGWKVLSIELRGPDEIEDAFRIEVGVRAGSLLVSAAGIPFSHARRVADPSAKNRLPSMYGLREYVEASQCWAARIR